MAFSPSMAKDFVLCCMISGLMVGAIPAQVPFVSIGNQFDEPPNETKTISDIFDDLGRSELPFGVSFKEIAPKSPQVTRIACIGDSITNGACASHNGNYPNVLQEKLGNGFLVTKFAACGRGASKKAKKSIWDETKLLRSAVNWNPDIIIIMFGTNDANEDSNPFDEDAFVTGYTALIKQFQGISSKPKVFISYPPPVYHESNMPTIGPAVNNKLHSPIKKISRSNLLPPPIDVFGAFQYRCKNLEGKCGLISSKPFPKGTSWKQLVTCSNDNVHPSDDGYKVIAELVEKRLRKDIECQTTTNKKVKDACTSQWNMWINYGIDFNR